MNNNQNFQTINANISLLYINICRVYTRERTEYSRKTERETETKIYVKTLFCINFSHNGLKILYNKIPLLKEFSYLPVDMY